MALIVLTHIICRNNMTLRICALDYAVLVQLKSSQIVFYVDETFRNNRGSSYLRWFESTLSEFCL